MKQKLFVAAMLVVWAGGAFARKPNESGQLVDSGSFGIFINGRRVATETFTINQRPEASVIASELRLEDGSKTAQTAELQIAANGDLRRYQWRELSPGKAEAVVEPKDQFLIEHLTASPTDKPLEQPFLMPVSTMVLDDYFFTHREVLAWRYLAGNCRQANGQTECKGGRSQFGVLVPRQRTSMLVNVEFTGREKINLRGSQRELNRLVLTAEGTEWAMWLDDQFKLVRILIAAENTEVVRD